MVATLQSRKEALEAKILEKNEELKKLCLQEADLTGVMPPEIPLEPGEPPPPVRRRVGTSFSFPQNLINNVKDTDDESLTALELECKVQTNIAEAALALANDSSTNKAARRKHRLMYRQSQRRLMELETRLNLLKQGKSQQLKSQQIKKKPRPNTTAVENIGFLWKKNNEQNYFNNAYLGSWPGKSKPSFAVVDFDGSREFAKQSEIFGSLQRPFKSNGTSQDSITSKTETCNDDSQVNLYNLSENSSFQNQMANLISSVNGSEAETNKFTLAIQQSKKNDKRPVMRWLWDTQENSTLLPNQTYPETSHQPNLSRTQSLGSMESNLQKAKDSWSVQDFFYEPSVREKEWYETSLDSAPSPPLRTTSRLPSTTRMLYQMQEKQSKDVMNWNNANIDELQSDTSQSALQGTFNPISKVLKVKGPHMHPPTDTKKFAVENLTDSLLQVKLNSNKRGKNFNVHINDSGIGSQKEFYRYPYNEGYEYNDYPLSKSVNESIHCPTDMNSKLDLASPSTSTDFRFIQNNESKSGLHVIKSNTMGPLNFKINSEPEKVTKDQDAIPMTIKTSYSNKSEDVPDGSKDWMTEEEFASSIKDRQIAVPQEFKPKQLPSQPYYHVQKNATGEKLKNLQYQAAKNNNNMNIENQFNYTPSLLQSAAHHPPHAITQNEISFDTVVPFESPQNHTVVQAGKWQPYREITKPFEMSDFYKYSTKFRQSQAQNNRTVTPDLTNTPNISHQKGIYTPLKPMTCRPVESKNDSIPISNQVDNQCVEIEKTLVEVSPPEIV